MALKLRHGQYWSIEELQALIHVLAPHAAELKNGRFSNEIWDATATSIGRPTVACQEAFQELIDIFLKLEKLAEAKSGWGWSWKDGTKFECDRHRETFQGWLAPFGLDDQAFYTYYFGKGWPFYKSMEDLYRPKEASQSHHVYNPASMQEEVLPHASDSNLTPLTETPAVSPVVQSNDEESQAPSSSKRRIITVRVKGKGKKIPDIPKDLTAAHLYITTLPRALRHVSGLTAHQLMEIVRAANHNASPIIRDHLTTLAACAAACDDDAHHVNEVTKSLLEASAHRVWSALHLENDS